MTIGRNRDGNAGSADALSMAWNNRCRNKLTEGEGVEGSAHGKSARLVPQRGPGRRRRRLAAGGLLLLGTALLGPTLMGAQGLPAWVIGPFTRPASGNPVIAPNPGSGFKDPLLNNSVSWEALHTFNPAAIVRDGKVFVLYRAEDNSGSMQIGMHTSRLGLAKSEDGIHFTRRPAAGFLSREG